MPSIPAGFGATSGHFLTPFRVTSRQPRANPEARLALLVTRGHSGCAALDDRAYVDLLQRALPRVGLRFRGFKNVRRQVCRRIAARIDELGLADPRAYERRLDEDPDELRVLDTLCFVTISRFYRDRRIWDALRDPLLPRLVEGAIAREERVVRAWSVGCASGEEPYTLAILWHLELATRFPAIDLQIIATDRDEEVLARAARAIYEPSSTREIPMTWRARAFESIEGGTMTRPREELRRSVAFERADARDAMPAAPIHLVLCRNMAFTYWAEAEQRALCARLSERMVPGALLVLGNHEALPDEPGALGLEPVAEAPHVYRTAVVRESSRS